MLTGMIARCEVETASTDLNLLLDLNPREVEVIRMALRAQEDSHKRNGFPVLVIEVSVLRAKISDALLDNYKGVR
jgi:hypothetical protein